MWQIFLTDVQTAAQGNEATCPKSHRAGIQTQLNSPGDHRSLTAGMMVANSRAAT